MSELTDDSDNILERFHMTECQSAHVLEGHWLLFEQPSFRGRMMYLKPGEHRSFRDLGYEGIRFSSIRRITDSC